MSSLRLLSDGLDPLDLSDWVDGIIDASLEVGAPEVRNVVYPRHGADGTDDHTTRVGGRGVTLGIVLLEGAQTRQALVDRLAPFMHPSRRITIEAATSPSAEPRRLRVRPVEVPLVWQNAASMTLAWSFRTVGLPYWTGEQRVVEIIDTGVAGRAYPLVRPRAYPAAAAPLAQATNAGNHEAEWTWTIDGPIVRPTLRNELTQEAVVLNGLVLLEDQQAIVDSATRSVTVDGQRRYGAVNQAATTWWTLSPGTTPITMSVETLGAAPSAFVSFADTYFA